MSTHQHQHQHRPSLAISTMSGGTRRDAAAAAAATAPPPSSSPSSHNHAGDDVPDAGLRSLDHYKRALPKWRYNLRQQALPLIRWETPYLAWMQDKLRTPTLDSYFAITANLGTHTFFMIGLPILFWCGYPAFGKGLVHILALGVFWTGFIKDLYSLPRPLSPPLHRITMSGSAALEYGFPSTHSANAVSVAVYGLLVLHSPDNTLAPTTKLFLEGLAYFYTVSIIFGRLYCGMHGFLDVIIGSIMGAAISLVEFHYGPSFDAYMHTSSWVAPVVAGLVVIILVRIHPEPADDCPCFDDSVAFAGVVIGLEFGTWTYGKIPGDPWETHAYADSAVDIAPLGLLLNVARIVAGVLVIFAWRETMKPAMLNFLPHAFRLIEQLGLSLPRRFFTPASEYKSVPPGSRIDTLFPTASDFPRMVESIRHPTTRGRSVSIGPQSAADAYETLAYRERRRRESIGSNHSLNSKPSNKELRSKDDSRRAKDSQSPEAKTTGAQWSPLREYEDKMGEGEVIITSQDGENDVIYVGQEDELEEEEVFSRLVKPRVRYDVEVVTKLVVYTGIAWLAVALIPLMFEFVGLGTNRNDK
ncbi:Dihydrosphingosine 1-phosphate phosphatase [Paramyrothecium foliicola]|nr:Dihydrosphingosine 1-phosphate phosphatase [Paramyrothecium foliicola]